METMHDKKIPLCFMMIMILLLLNSCVSGKEQMTQAETVLSTDQYHMEKTSLVKIAEYQPKDLFFTPGGDACFFLSKSEDTYMVYRMSLEADAKPEQLISFQGETVFSWNGSCDGEFSLFTYFNDEACLFEYDMDGNIRQSIILKDSDAYKIYAFSHWKLPGESFVIMGRQKILCVNAEGEIVWSVGCPGESFQGGILASNGDMYVSYVEQDDKRSLATLDLKNGQVQAMIDIPGAGNIFSEDKNGEIYTIDSDYVYRIDAKKPCVIPVMDLRGFRGLISNRIASMHIKDEGFTFLSWNSAKPWKSMDYVELLPGREESVTNHTDELRSAKTDESGRQIITLYDPYDMAGYMIGSSIIDSFNEENEKYVIQIDAKQKNVNARMAEQDSPDLILLLIDSDMEKYYENGYLENLLPYFQESSMIPAEELAASFFKTYGFDEGLYSICRYVTFSSLYGLESEVGNQEGWTVAEFLQWIEEHPNLYTNSDVTNLNLLDDCLRGNMKKYVSDDGKAYFEDKPFRDMLERIKKINCNVKGNESVRYDQVKDVDQTYFSHISMQNVAELARIEALYGEKLVRKGFPNDDGEAVSHLFGWGNLCMLKRGACKDGAFEFLEYMLIDPWYSMQDATTDYDEYLLFDAKGSLHTVKKVLERDMELALGKHVINFYDENGVVRHVDFEVTKEQEERVIKAWNEALPDTYENQMIRSIVEEEAEVYFLGQKDLDETCRVIQNRVQLFLNEID